VTTALPPGGGHLIFPARLAAAAAVAVTITITSQGVVLRGDWRQSVQRARTTGEASARGGLLTELSRFGVDAAPPLAREVIPFSNSPASEDARGRYDAENKSVTGHETLTWHNASHAAATHLEFHLYLNAFANSHSSFSSYSISEDPRWRASENERAPIV
jgi:hypothetical protein